MNLIKRLSLLASVLLLPQVSFGQLTRAALATPSAWYVPGTDSAYYQAKMLTFVSDARALPPKLCKYTTWEITARKFTLASYDGCTRPDIASVFLTKKKLRLSTKNNIQLLNIYRSGKLVDSFEVLAIAPTGIEDSQRLTLKRIMPKVAVY